MIHNYGIYYCRLKGRFNNVKKQFKAETKRLLDLMINSIYTHKEIISAKLYPTQATHRTSCAICHLRTKMSE